MESNDTEKNEDSPNIFPINSESMAKILRPREESSTFNEIVNKLLKSENNSTESCTYETRCFSLAGINNVLSMNADHNVSSNISENSLF